jgi:hypothetical protein
MSPTALSYLPGVTIAIGFTLGWNLLRVDNPARILWRRAWHRAAFGIACSLVAWSLIAMGICLALDAALPTDGWNTRGRLLVGAAAGLVAPQLYLAHRLIRRSWYRDPWSAAFAAVLVWYAEGTTLYPLRIITREERKVADHILESGDAALTAVDRLCELHLVGIVRQVSVRCKPEERAWSARLARVRNRAIKVKYLLRYLGATDCLDAVRITAKEPDAIMPSWPAGAGDRRGSHNRRVGALDAPVERRLVLPKGPRRMDPPGATRVLLLAARADSDAG